MQHNNFSLILRYDICVYTFQFQRVYEHIKRQHPSYKPNTIEIIDLNNQENIEPDIFTENLTRKIKEKYDVENINELSDTFKTHFFPRTIISLADSYSNIVHSFFTNPLGKKKSRDNKSLKLTKLWTIRHVKMVILFC